MPLRACVSVWSGRLGFAWRWLATGFIFLSFGLCGTAFSLVLFPLTLVWPHRASAQRIIAAAVHAYFSCLVALLQRVGVMRLEVTGEVGRIAGGALVVANHPTYLDVMILLALIPSACCVVKHAHWRNPCFLGIVRAAGYVSNADAVSLVKDGTRRLNEGYSLILFPEGTRSPPRGGLHRFSRGFAHIALSAQTEALGETSMAPVVPVALDCDPPVFTKERRWYHVPSRPFRFRVTVLGSVDPHRWAGAQASTAMAARSLASDIQDQIHQHLSSHELAQARN